MIGFISDIIKKFIYGIAFTAGILFTLYIIFKYWLGII